jgi:NodT family efflux transporter outer membrane factor (OMF) lipoprotein
MSSPLNPRCGLRCVAACCALLAASCAVGPNFKPPEAPQGAGYATAPLQTTAAAADVVGGPAQRFVAGLDIPRQWWTLFHSQALDALVARSLEDNPDLRAAQAALRVAREDVLAQRGAYYPAITAGMSASRARQSDVLAPTPNYPAVSNEFQYNLFTPELTISYVPDVFGLNRRTVESLQAQEEAARFQLIATYVTLSTNVAVAAIQEASVREQISVTERMIRLDSQMLAILRYQFKKGYASGLDLAAQQSQLAQMAATLPPLRKQLAAQHDLLAALVGGFPNQRLGKPLAIADLSLPQEVPVSLPSRLVEQRPDVRQAEANLHAASAQIGIAEAQRLPNLTLSADAGTTALAINRLFTSGTSFWGAEAALTAPLFQGGALLHRERAAKAAYSQAREQYRSTVITAFQNVADTLSALEQDGAALKTAAAANAAAKATFELTRRQTQAGYSNQLALLNAEQAYLQASINLVQSQANRFVDTAALFQALGGGWWKHAHQ